MQLKENVYDLLSKLIDIWRKFSFKFIIIILLYIIIDLKLYYKSYKLKCIQYNSNFKTIYRHRHNYFL